MILATFLEKTDTFVKETGVNFTFLYVILGIIVVIAYMLLLSRMKDNFMKLFYGLLSVAVVIAIIYIFNDGDIPINMQFVVIFFIIISLIYLIDYLITKPQPSKTIIIDNHSHKELEADYYRDYRLPNSIGEQIPEKKKKSI